MIRFIQYPRNSVENLNRALYIKLLKTQWLSGSKKISPSPRGGREVIFAKTTRNETYKNYYYLQNLHVCIIACHVFLIAYLIYKFSIMYTRRHPEPRIPPDSRSVQILYRISGMLNERSFTHR